MSLKVRFYFEYFTENFRDFREEMSERFHENIQIMEARYQGWLDMIYNGRLLLDDASIDCS